MTTPDLTSLPDAALNAMVAKAMGWTHRPEPYGALLQWTDPHGKKRYGCLDWAGDIADAWALVEQSKGTMDFTLKQRNGICYVAEFAVPSKEFEAVAATAPRAIVLAWLLAKGGV